MAKLTALNGNKEFHLLVPLCNSFNLTAVFDYYAQGRNFKRVQMAITSGFFRNAARKDPQEGFKTLVRYHGERHSFMCILCSYEFNILRWKEECTFMAQNILDQKKKIEPFPPPCRWINRSSMSILRAPSSIGSRSGLCTTSW